VGIATEVFKTLVQRVLVILIVAKLLDDLAAWNNDSAREDIWFFLAAYLLGAVIGILGELSSIKTTDERYEVLAIKYYQRLAGKDMAFYRNQQVGYLRGLFRQHLDGTMNLLRLFRGDITRMFVSLVFPVIVLLIMNWRIGLIVAIAVPMECKYVMWASKRANKYRKPAQEIYRRLTGEVADAVTNAAAFKSSGREEEEGDKVTGLVHEEKKAFLLRHRSTTILDLPRAIVTGGITALALFVAVATVPTNSRLISLIVITVFYLLQIMQQVGELPDLVLRHDEHIAKVWPTLQYMGNKYETVVDPQRPKTLQITQGTIEVRGVEFSYKGSGSATGATTKVLSNVSLRVEGGEHIGIVGESGVGKSTLVGLMMRFDDVDAGSITIDGIDIRDVRQSELRQAVAYIPQEPLLFNRTIRENISYFKKGASDEEIVSAATAAQAHDFISKLEKGYDTDVGERGSKLSGGQRQRIILARAILKNAPIMIFDEATSSLDSESERAIQRVLPAIIGKHTAIVIAHRLSTVKGLSRILVMHGGRIEEEGTHQELLALGGRYSTLWHGSSAA
jgi:ATP-binding cassette subfamily B protein